MTEWLYYMAAAREPDQLAHMQQLQRDQVCIFCEEHFDREHEAPIERTTDQWLVTKNDHPYDGLRVHLLLMPRTHVTDISQLPIEAGAELFALYGLLKIQYELSGPALIIRTGDMRRNGGSIAHLHAHLVEGDGVEAVKFKVASAPEDWEALPDWAK